MADQLWLMKHIREEEEEVTKEQTNVVINTDDQQQHIVSCHCGNSFCHCRQFVQVLPIPVCRSGNALDSFNVVTLHRTRLVPGWVFVQIYHLGTEPGTQVAQPEPSLSGLWSLLGKKQRVLCNSRPCDQDCVRTGLSSFKGAGF